MIFKKSESAAKHFAERKRNIQGSQRDDAFYPPSKEHFPGLMRVIDRD